MMDQGVAALITSTTSTLCPLGTRKLLGSAAFPATRLARPASPREQVQARLLPPAVPLTTLMTVRALPVLVPLDQASTGAAIAFAASNRPATSPGVSASNWLATFATSAAVRSSRNQVRIWITISAVAAKNTISSGTSRANSTAAAPRRGSAGRIRLILRQDHERDLQEAERQQRPAERRQPARAVDHRVLHHIARAAEP